MISCCTQGTAQTVRWSCETIISSIKHLEGSTEVELNSWWKAASCWSMNSFKVRANFIENAMTCFWMPGFEIHSFWKKYLWMKNIWWCQVELRELLRLSLGFVKRCFYRSIILRVQLKSNWTVGKKLLVSDKRAVGKFKLILYKGLIYSFQKKAVFQGALSCYTWYSF